MTSKLSIFAARLSEFIAASIPVAADVSRLKPNPEREPGQIERGYEPTHVGCYEEKFNALALELFGLQFAHNAAYRRICEARHATPLTVSHWSQIPAVPTAAFKELELTCLVPAQRTHVFHSSGTTEQRPSRHFHSSESLAVYEEAALTWFRVHIANREDLLLLPPSPTQAPHSSLVHMFETVRRHVGASEAAFVGHAEADGSWRLDFAAASQVLNSACHADKPLIILGTAFAFVQLLDSLEQMKMCFQLPPGSQVMETGGYKGRSRSLPKVELHALITERLGISPSHIVGEYGMSELSSQAYDRVTGDGWQVTRSRGLESCHFHFPPWARVQIISPETGFEVADGETGLIRVFDLANVFSVMAIQTEDLGVRHGDGFELIGRAALAESRGCSLMAV